MSATEHAAEIGAALRHLDRAMLHAGFWRRQFGLAITEAGALESLRCIALSAADVVHRPLDEARMLSWWGVPLHCTYLRDRRLDEINVGRITGWILAHAGVEELAEVAFAVKDRTETLRRQP